MKYSMLVRSDGIDHLKIAEKLCEKENEDGMTDRVIYLYVPSNVNVPADLASKVHIISASHVNFIDIINVILTFNTLRYADIFNVPRDVLFIIPNSQLHTRQVATELMSAVLNQLVYMGVRLYLISDGRCAADDLNYDEVVDASHFMK